MSTPGLTYTHVGIGACEALTKELWREQVRKSWPVRPARGQGAPEPFFPPRPYNTLKVEQQSSNRSQLMGELLGAMARQAAFLHSLMRPCYLERPFLEAALERYYMFLQLMKENPGMTLVPMMDIDLMWHTHMGISSAYTADMLSYCGRVIGHDDGIAKHDLDEMFGATKALFEARFPEAGPYNPPPTQLIPLAVRHPLEAHLGPALLQLFQHPHQRSRLEALPAQAAAAKAAVQLSSAADFPATPAQGSLGEIKGAVAAPPAPLCPVGGHAVYLAWLLSSEAHYYSREVSCLCSCFGPSRDANAPLTPAQRRTSIHGTFSRGLKFTRFKHLPLHMDHIFWEEFAVRQLPAWGMRSELTGGMAVGVPADAASVAAGRPARASFGYAPSAHCPGCSRDAASGGCCCRSQRYAPYDMAMLPILLPTSIGYWGCCGGAYPGNPGASADAAVAASDSAPAEGTELAAVAASPEFSSDVGAAASSDPGAWSSADACDQWVGVNANGQDAGASMCGGGACGGGGGGGCGGDGGGGGCGG